MLLFALLSAPVFARAYMQVYAGLNLVVEAAPRPALGFGLSASGSWVPLGIGPVLGPDLGGGWVFGHGPFFHAGAAVGLVYQDRLDCLGYYPVPEVSALFGYQWQKSASGLRLGGRAQVILAGTEAAFVHDKHWVPQFELGARLPLFQPCILNNNKLGV